MVDESVMLETNQEVIKQEFNTSLSNKVIEEEICESENHVKQEIQKFYDFETMQLRSNIGVPRLVNSSNIKSSQETGSHKEVCPKILSEVAVSPKSLSEVALGPKSESDVTVSPKSESGVIVSPKSQSDAAVSQDMSSNMKRSQESLSDIKSSQT